MGRVTLPFAGLTAATLIAVAATAAAQDADATDEPPAPTGLSAIDEAIAALADLDLGWESGEFAVRVGGRLAVDAIDYDGHNARSSGVRLHEARVVLDGDIGPVRWHVEPDLVGVDTRSNLWEAWASYEFSEHARVKAGQMRVALNSEFATREEWLPPTGYGFPSHLDGRHDVGLRLDGSVWHDRFWYQATVTTGNGFGMEGQRLDSRQYSIRLVARPFHDAEPEDSFFAEVLRNVTGGIGLAALSEFDDPVVVSTPLQSTTFETRDLDGDDGSWAHYEIGSSYGPLRITFERVVGAANDVPVGGGATEDFDQLTAFSFQGAWNVTGEEQQWKDGRWTSAPSRSNRGRWELAARYSNADIDRGLLDLGLVVPGQATQEVRVFTGTVNWYMSPNVRLSFGWTNTIADEELVAFGGHKRDSSLVLRLDINF